MQSILDLLWKNKEWVFSGLGIAIIVSLISIVKFIFFPKYKLKINHTYSVSFEQIGTQFGPNIPMLTVHIINVGSHALHIQEPTIFTLKKINGENEFQVINYNRSTQSQIPLAPTARFTMDFPIRALYNQVLSKLDLNDNIMIITRDFRRKKYCSKKIKVNEIVDRMNSVK